jgi:SAM-dependent methyltransferase
MTIPILMAKHMAELDTMIERVDALINDDYAEAMRILGSFELLLECPQDLDPYSPEYRDWVRRFHALVARLDAYDTQFSGQDWNVDPELPLSEYFPFSTRDAGFVGSYLMGVGFILRNLNLPTGSRIIEYDVGWGHVSAACARSGFDITCVGIRPTFLRIASRQAEAMGNRVRTVEGEFGIDPYGDGSLADGVIFFEAFHHALDHMGVLERLRRILRPGGVLILCGEPINPGYPVPWGIRPDGHALWAVRKYGWMELGFNEDYFLRLMMMYGFLVEKVTNEDLGILGLLYRCTRTSGEVLPGTVLMPSDESATWAPWSETVCRFAQEASRMTLDNAPEWKAITVEAVNHLHAPLTVTFLCGQSRVEHRFAAGEKREITLSLLPFHRELHIASETRIPSRIMDSQDNRSLGIAIERITYDEK